ncbi:hypothetical protein JVU11DRAFT_11259 [Chiua virens]|nr:hypothetical protein JVU11DRAFT_11259 [Chiua virens]
MLPPPLDLPLAAAKFSLNSAGVAGFFGGEEAISAMATVHLYEGRRWLGWFNSPGSYTIAKRFGRMANSRFWDGLFPGSNDSPAVSFELDGKKGPEYIAPLSGTTMRTGHLAYLTMKRVKEIEDKKVIQAWRTTRSVDVAYLPMSSVDYQKPVKRMPLEGALYGLIPISVSIFTCIMCGMVEDWISFSMILFGIISSGLASCFIGEGLPVLKSVVNPAQGSPPGHGILLGSDGVVVIKGKERDVNAITKGRFDLRTNQKGGDVEKGPSNHYHAIGVCSLLLLFQFLLQLLVIPQGTLFGQTMFLISLGVSWGYNSYLSSLEKEKIQMDLLFEILGNPKMQRFRVGTRTAMTTFACLLLFHNAQVSIYEEDREETIEGILHSCVSNDTRVWKRWRAKVTKQLLNIDPQTKSLPHLTVDQEDNLSESDQNLLEELLHDARDAFAGYFKHSEELPSDSAVEAE